MGYYSYDGDIALGATNIAWWKTHGIPVLLNPHGLKMEDSTDIKNTPGDL